MALQSRRQLLGRLGTLAAASLLGGCAAPGTGEDASPTPSATTSGSDADVSALEERARSFVRLLAAGSYEEAAARFSPLVADRVSAADLRTVWQALESQYGEFVTAADPEYGTTRGYDQVTLTLAFERGQERFVVTFGEDGLLGFQLAGAATGEWEVPPYADPSAFETRDRAIRATEDCRLSAELTLPTGTVPGVVLVHGSGPHDMDETIGPNKPFKDLAWGLSSRGIAVLRYDKRTAACDVDLADASIDEVVTSDALAALSRLREHERVDEVVLVGHSLGAALAPRIATRDGDVAGVVMLAAPARPVTETILAQHEYLMTLDGELSAAERDRLAEIERKVRRIRRLDIAEDEVVFLGGREYWRTLQSVDVAAEAAALEVPRLLLQGGRDYQVTVEADLTRLRQALGEDRAVTVSTYPDLNHLFMPGEGQSTPGEYVEPNHVDRAVIEDVASWIHETAAAEGRPAPPTLS